jgi:hypothetical protein
MVIRIIRIIWIATTSPPPTVFEPRIRIIGPPSLPLTIFGRLLRLRCSLRLRLLFNSPGDPIRPNISVPLAARDVEDAQNKSRLRWLCHTLQSILGEFDGPICASYKFRKCHKELASRNKLFTNIRVNRSDVRASLQASSRLN